MARIWVLDSGPAGIACARPKNDKGGIFRAWISRELFEGHLVVIPEIVDYEVRRSLALAGDPESIQRLDDLYNWTAEIPSITYLPISTRSMRVAADLWAQARREHRPTAADTALDGDVIVAAQAQEFCRDSDDWEILTGNIAHIARYVGDRARSHQAVVDDWLKSQVKAHEEGTPGSSSAP